MELTLKLVFWIGCLAMVDLMYMSGGAEGARPLSAIIECNGDDDSVAIAIGVPYQQQYNLGSILAKDKSYGSRSMLKSSTPPPGKSSETRASLASTSHSHGYGIEALNTDNIIINNIINNNNNNNKNAGETSSVDNNSGANPNTLNILAGITPPPGKSTTTSATLVAMEIPRDHAPKQTTRGADDDLFGILQGSTPAPGKSTITSATLVAMDIHRDDEATQKTRGADDLLTILQGSTAPPGKSTTTSATLVAMVDIPKDRKPKLPKMAAPSTDGMFSILKGSTSPPGKHTITSSPTTMAFIVAPPPQA